MTVLPYVICFLCGAGLVGAWWWWINHKAKARADLAKIVDTAKKV